MTSISASRIVTRFRRTVEIADALAWPNENIDLPNLRAIAETEHEMAWTSREAKCGLHVEQIISHPGKQCRNQCCQKVFKAETVCAGQEAS